ncbi:MAG: N-sulfoglucosamine sulfohydrolase [Candidatus Omnitrophota bacterium]|jgi:N-sulfoglucosamine sulfohydrolase
MKSLIALLFMACGLAVSLAAPRSNFVLIIADDIGYNDLGCYGSPDARTPHIDALAREGIRFTNAILTASSCSPSRSSIITGRYPHNNGNAAELHRPMPWHLPSFTGLLEDAGYHTALNGKDHMTWEKAPAGEQAPTRHFATSLPSKVRGNSGGHGNWVKTIEAVPVDKPFFLWLAAHDAHRGWDADRQWDAERYGPAHDPARLTLPPALVDTTETRKDFASYLNEVTRFDHYVGEVVAKLKQAKHWENTYLFVLTDNGRPFPRAKTRLHDDGMKTFFIVTGPGVQPAGAVSASLISVIDIAPTVFELAGLERAKTFQGRSLIPAYADVTATIRPYAFSESNWHDYEALGRSVREGRWLFIRNFRPMFAQQGPADSVSSSSFRAILSAAETPESAVPLTPIQADVLLAPRPAVELYDTQGDPHQVSNLAGMPAYTAIEKKLAGVLENWMELTGDSVPDEVSHTNFDPRTGRRLGQSEAEYRRPAPGVDRGADRIHSEGF